MRLTHWRSPTAHRELGVPQRYRIRASALAVACLAMLATAAPSYANQIPRIADDGTGMSRGPDLGEIVGRPGVSANGTKLVYAKRGSNDQLTLWTSNSDGGGPKSLGVTGGFPVFTPSGDIIFETTGTTSVIAKVSATGTNRTTLVDIPNQTERHPSIGANGTKLVFTSGGGSSRRRVYIANINGSSATKVPMPDGFHDDSYPALAPNGNTIAFTRQWTTLPYNTPTPGQLFVVSAAGGTPQARTGADEHTYMWGPQFSPSSNYLAYTAGAQSSYWTGNDLYRVAVDGTTKQRVTNIVGDEYAPIYAPDGKLRFIYDGPTDEGLLWQFVPDLRYDTAESYRAGSPGMLSDSYVPTTLPGGHTNRLKNTNGSFAASDPDAVGPTLSLGFLNSPKYGDNVTPSVSSDFIDADDGDYVADAQRMSAKAGYGDRTYGRVVSTPDGGKILQYWFFYYYNPKTFFTQGAHEGDWEMAQVHIDANNNPHTLTYAQHEEGERCGFGAAERNDGYRPIIYVAEGSHASYFSQGPHRAWGPTDDVVDNANGGAPGSPLEPVDLAGSPGWLKWPGSWGASMGSGESPHGPKFQGLKWSNPLQWSQNARTCRPQTARANRRRNRLLSAQAPRRPVIRASRRGRSVRVHYRFRSTSKRPWQLLVSVQSRNRRVPPRTERVHIGRSRGVISARVGLGKAPYTLRVIPVARNGVRGRAIVRRLR